MKKNSEQILILVDKFVEDWFELTIQKRTVGYDSGIEKKLRNMETKIIDDMLRWRLGHDLVADKLKKE